MSFYFCICGAPQATVQDWKQRSIVQTFRNTVGVPAGGLAIRLLSIIVQKPEELVQFLFAGNEGTVGSKDPLKQAL